MNQLVCKILNIDPSSDLSVLRYGQPANWDSIRHVELFIALQKEFKIYFLADEIVRLNTYKELQKAVRLKVQP